MRSTPLGAGMYLDGIRTRFQTKTPVSPGVLRRGGRDSNPRLRNPSTHLAGEPNRPLWHLPNEVLLNFQNSGGRGIRTPGGLTPTHVFKTCTLSRSVIPPEGIQYPSRLSFYHKTPPRTRKPCQRLFIHFRQWRGRLQSIYVIHLQRWRSYHHRGERCLKSWRRHRG